MLPPPPTRKLGLGGEYTAWPLRCPPASDSTWQGLRKEAHSWSWGVLPWVLPVFQGQDTAAASGRAEEHITDSTPKPEASSQF